MDRLVWHDVAKAFEFDGAWLDLVVRGTDLALWQKFLDALRSSRYEFAYLQLDRASGVRCQSPLPERAEDAFPEHGMADRLLSVQLAGPLANCHFFTPDEIEFDIDPREIGGQDQFDALVAFLQLMANATGKDAVVTPENMTEVVMFRVRPHHRGVQYCLNDRP